VRVGVVGLGRVGVVHARNAAQHPDVEQVLLLGRDEGRLARGRAAVVAAGAHPGALTTSSDVGAALDGRAGLDLLVIATSTPSHPELARRGATAGVPLLVEKPLALHVAELEALAADLEATGTPVAVAFHRRYDPESQRLRALVASGALGTVRTARAVDADRTPVDLAYVPGSGGLWRDLAVHDLDLLPWLLDDPVVAVTAFAAVLAQPELTVLGDHDTGTAVLQHASGAVSTVAVARGNGAGQDVRLEVSGSSSSAALGPASGTSTGFADFTERFQPAFRAELDQALRQARGEAEVLTPPRAGVAALRLAVAAEESARAGATVRV
jgi:myo-inositol 2-dehydrogenase / D-chiro-inositol 1-dehydrogenase